MTLRLAPLLLALCASSAVAQEARLTGMAEEVIRSQWSEPISVIDGTYLFVSFAFAALPAGLRFDLSLSGFDTVEEAFGGTPHTSEIEGIPVAWLCYDTGDTRITFASFRESLIGVPAIDVLVEERVTAPSDGCTSNPAAAAPTSAAGTPGIGATLADLEQMFGQAPADANGRLAYITQVPVSGTFDGTETKILYYRVESDAITDVAYARRFAR